VVAVYDRRQNSFPEKVCDAHRAPLQKKVVMKEFLEFVIRQLVEFPDDMVLTEIPGGKTTIFKVQLRQSDVGRVIGRNGQTIQAIRALLNSSASRHGQRATLEIVE
jgi:predicted RNA-binding protein YlqC (UPF0109 family)